MLRVLSLGLSLPQTTPTVLQSFRASKWLISLHSLRVYPVRPVSDLSSAFIEPQRSKNGRDTVQEGEGEEKHEPKSVIPSRFVREMDALRQDHLRKRIRPLRVRPSRPPPKYSSAAELPSDPVTREEALPQNVVITPVHPKQRGVDGNIPSLPEITYWPGRENRTGSPEVRTRNTLLRVLATSRSASEAWDAYEILLKRPRFRSRGRDVLLSTGQRVPLAIPYEHLHRFARLLSSTYPRTRRLFLRLLSVLTTLRDSGGTIFVWEWNALIDCAGKGWRKTTMDDYRAALGIFKEMVTSDKTARYSQNLPFDDVNDDNRAVAQPDIITFTTLLNIASQSLSERAISHATSLLAASELPWNHVTRMSRLRYLIHTGQFHAILEILQEAIYRGLDLVTLNGCLWAYAYNGRLRVALEVYELLRCNVPMKDRTDFGETPTSDLSSQQNDQSSNPILHLSNFVIPEAMCPDKITYTLLIQAMSYHGDFIAAMRIFRDMVSTVDPTTRVSYTHPTGRRPETGGSCYKPTLPVYRAIFLGFARHTRRYKSRTSTSTLIMRPRSVDSLPLSEFAARLTPSDPGAGTRLPPVEQPEEESHWTLENLEAIFESFLQIGWDGESNTDGQPSERTIYWIMVAYAKTTKGDVGKMWKVLLELDERFGVRRGQKAWSRRLARLSERLENRYSGSAGVENDDPEKDPNG